MFQTELLSVRRNNNRGTVTPIFIGEDFYEYSKLVRDLFSSMVGKRRRDIHEELRDLELKVQYNKVIKGLGEIMFRQSRFSSSGSLEPAEIRKEIFLMTPHGIQDPGERSRIFDKIAAQHSASPQEVEEAMYSDMEEEEILLEVADIEDEELCRHYNLEQAETLLLKAFQMNVKDVSDWGSLARESKKLGLLFSTRVVSGEIVEMKFDGPLSAVEETRRYSIRFAQLLRFLITLEKWSFDCTVVLEKDRKKDKFSFHLDSYAESYFPQKISGNTMPHDPGLKAAAPIIVGDDAFFPDYFIEKGERKAFIEVTRTMYRDFNEKIKAKLGKMGIDAIFVYLLGTGDKPIKGETCFRDSIDWDAVIQSLFPDRKEESKARSPANVEKVDIEELRSKVNRLWPDLDSMFREIEAAGLDLVDTLKDFGYSTRWEGLSLKIVKNS